MPPGGAGPDPHDLIWLEAAADMAYDYAYDEGEANSDSDGTDIGDQTDVAVQTAVTVPQQDTGGLNAWLRDGETSQEPRVQPDKHTRVVECLRTKQKPWQSSH